MKVLHRPSESSRAFIGSKLRYTGPVLARRPPTPVAGTLPEMRDGKHEDA